MRSGNIEEIRKGKKGRKGKNMKRRKMWRRRERKEQLDRFVKNSVLYRMRECRFQGIYIEG